MRRNGSLVANWWGKLLLTAGGLWITSLLPDGLGVGPLDARPFLPGVDLQGPHFLQSLPTPLSVFPDFFC